MEFKETEVCSIALAKCIQDVKWIKGLLEELGEKLETPVIYEDNQACIAIATSSGSRQGTKHIEMRYHFVKNAIQDKEVCLKYIKSEEQVADMMTKPIGRIGLTRFRPVLFSGAFVNRAKVTYASIVVDGKEREHGIGKEREHGIEHGIEHGKCLGFNGTSISVQLAV